MLETLGRARRDPLQASLSTLMTSVKRWSGHAALDDDVSIVAFEMPLDS